MIRDARWKLIVYKVDGYKTTQLFDLDSDPDELHNLADDPSQKSTREQLEAMLTQARAECGDPVDF